MILNPFKDLVINEIQSNQGGVKEISIARDNIKPRENKIRKRAERWNNIFKRSKNIRQFKKKTS